jgi:Tol biopolymer transport system component
MNPDGTGQVPFPGTAGALSLKFQSWSPDGTKALFTAVPIGQADDDEFYSINADGAGLVQITNDAVVTLGGSWGPSVSP